MNKDLQGREFIIPPYIMKYIANYRETNSGIGEIRSDNFLTDGKLTYGQLKKLLHDMKYMDKQSNLEQYHLYGGEEMERWGSTILGNERELIQNRKKSRERATNAGGINNMVTNSHNVKHSKRPSFLPPTNLIKSNSEKSSVSSLSLGKIFEEIMKKK